MLVPSPTSPPAFWPQAQTVPSGFRTSVWWKPAAIAVAPENTWNGDVRPAVPPSPSCAQYPSPQVQTVPSPFSATECASPDATAPVMM